MSATNTPVEVPEKLPRRDLVLLPLLSFLTVLVMFAGSEVAARFFWPENEADSCEIRPTPSVGDRHRANCSSRVKLAEGPWVDNSYNECGYRSAASCASKRPGTIRIAVLGSSFAEGFMVPYEETYMAHTERELTRQCGRPVEIQNLSGTGLLVSQISGRAEEALELKPDIVAIILSANDLVRDPGDAGRAAAKEEAAAGPAAQNRPRLAEFIPFLLRHSRVLFMIRHFVYRDPETYLRIYLRTHGDAADYLRPPLSPLWQKRMANTDGLLAEMADKFHSQNVPVLLVPALFYPQVALLNAPQPVLGTNVHLFEQELSAIAAKHKIDFVPMTDEFARLPHSEDLFYTGNGHMAAPGQVIYARSFVRQLTEGHFLEPFGCAAHPIASGHQPDKESAGSIADKSSALQGPQR